MKKGHIASRGVSATRQTFLADKVFSKLVNPKKRESSLKQRKQPQQALVAINKKAGIQPEVFIEKNRLRQLLTNSSKSRDKINAIISKTNNVVPRNGRERLVNQLYDSRLKSSKNLNLQQFEFPDEQSSHYILINDQDIPDTAMFDKMSKQQSSKMSLHKEKDQLEILKFQILMNNDFQNLDRDLQVEGIQAKLKKMDSSQENPTPARLIQVDTKTLQINSVETEDTAALVSPNKVKTRPASPQPQLNKDIEHVQPPPKTGQQTLRESSNDEEAMKANYGEVNNYDDKQNKVYQTDSSHVSIKQIIDSAQSEQKRNAIISENDYMQQTSFPDIQATEPSQDQNEMTLGKSIDQQNNHPISEVQFMSPNLQVQAQRLTKLMTQAQEEQSLAKNNRVFRGSKLVNRSTKHCFSEKNLPKSPRETHITRRINRPQTGQNLRQIEKLKYQLKKRKQIMPKLQKLQMEMHPIQVTSHRPVGPTKSSQIITLAVNESQTEEQHYSKLINNENSSRRPTDRVQMSHRNESPYGAPIGLIKKIDLTSKPILNQEYEMSAPNSAIYFSKPSPQSGSVERMLNQIQNIENESFLDKFCKKSNAVRSVKSANPTAIDSRLDQNIYRMRSAVNIEQISQAQSSIQSQERLTSKLDGAQHVQFLQNDSSEFIISKNDSKKFNKKQVSFKQMPIRQIQFGGLDDQVIKQNMKKQMLQQFYMDLRCSKSQYTKLSHIGSSHSTLAQNFISLHGKSLQKNPTFREVNSGGYLTQQLQQPGIQSSSNLISAAIVSVESEQKPKIINHQNIQYLNLNPNQNQNKFVKKSFQDTEHIETKAKNSQVDMQSFSGSFSNTHKHIVSYHKKIVSLEANSMRLRHNTIKGVRNSVSRVKSAENRFNGTPTDDFKRHSADENKMQKLQAAKFIHPQENHVFDHVHSLESLTRMFDQSSKRRSILSRDNTTQYKMVSKQHVATGMGFKTVSPFEVSHSNSEGEDNFIREYVIKSDKDKSKSPNKRASFEINQKIDKIQQEYLQQILNDEALQGSFEVAIGGQKSLIGSDSFEELSNDEKCKQTQNIFIQERSISKEQQEQTNFSMILYKPPSPKESIEIQKIKQKLKKTQSKMPSNQSNLLKKKYYLNKDIIYSPSDQLFH